MSATPPSAPRPQAVVIGGSAGGLDALGILLRDLSRGDGPAILVCIHISERHPQLLPQALAMRSALDVVEAGDQEPILPSRIHVAVPRYHLQVSADRRCSLSQDEAVCFSRPSIDVLFETAAWAYGPQLLGILLSGASADGAAGLQTIRQHGGRTWVQDPDTAAATTMPAAAIARGAADAVMTPQEMAHALQPYYGSSA